MRHLFFWALISITAFGQGNFIEAELIDKKSLNIDVNIGKDNFGNHYFISANTLYKVAKNDTLNYSNYQLGNITSANVFNPLKINLFYQDFNQVIILDNRLAEIFKIDFNTLQPYKNATQVSVGFDNTLWLFNQDLQSLQLYNYRTKKNLATTVPIQSQALALASNYNNCWLLTENFLYTYNYQGSMISKMKNDGYTELSLDNGNIILKKDNDLYVLAKHSIIPIKIELPKLLIKQFSLTDETLYIYDSKFLYQFQLKL